MSKVTNQSSGKKQTKKTISRISSIKYPYQKEWDVSKTHVTFDVKNILLSIMNGIRRTIMSDVKTFGVRTMPYKQSMVQCIKNASPLHDQIIAHRIGLLPLHIIDENFQIDDYEFSIDVTNKENKFRDITTNDIQIMKISDGAFLKKEEVQKIFPKDPLLGTDIIITKLKPVYSINTSMFNNISGESANYLNFHIKFKATLGSGSENACFHPQSAISCIFKEDPERVALEREKFIKTENEKYKENNLTPKSKEELVKFFDTTHKERYYYKDDEGEPYYFEYLIESVGPVPPLIIFHRGIQALIDRVTNFEINLKSENSNIITVSPSHNINNGLEFKITNENDTLGNLIQDYIFNKFCNNQDEEKNIVSYVGYKRTHPLEEFIIFNIVSIKYREPMEVVTNIFIPVCQAIVRKLKILQNELEETNEYISELKSIK